MNSCSQTEKDEGKLHLLFLNRLLNIVKLALFNEIFDLSEVEK